MLQLNDSDNKDYFYGTLCGVNCDGFEIRRYGTLTPLSRPYSNLNKILVNDPQVPINTLLIDHERYAHLIELKNEVSSNVAPKNASIYVIQPCKYAIADVRRNYSIKRDYNEANFILLPEDFTTSLRFAMNFPVVIPSKRVVFACSHSGWSFLKDYTKSPTTGEIQLLYSQIINEEFSDVNKSEIFYCQNMNGYLYPTAVVKNQVIINMLENNIDKHKLVTDSGIQVDTGMTLTADAFVILNSIDQKKKTKEAYQKATMQLMAINNLDWRAMKKPVGYILASIKEANGVVYDMALHKSKYPKPVQELLDIKWEEYGNLSNYSKEEYEFVQQYFKQLLSMGDVKFVSTNAFFEKLKVKGIEADRFCNMFDCIIKITPKQYEKRPDTY